MLEKKKRGIDLVPLLLVLALLFMDKQHDVKTIMTSTTFLKKV
jgi:hypothetical protein